jgi:hypothetical protein
MVLLPLQKSNGNGRDGRFFPAEPSNRSELLQKKQNRSDDMIEDQQLPGGTTTVVTKQFLQKCRAGIDEIRMSIHQTSGHHVGISQQFLGESESSLESSFASFGASFSSNLAASSDVDNNNDKSNDDDSDDDSETVEDGQDDCIEEDDVYDNDDISLEGPFHDDHIEALHDDQSKRSLEGGGDAKQQQSSSGLLQLSFEGGQCIVQNLSESKTDDEEDKEQESTDGKKDRKLPRSNSMRKRRSRSHENLLRNNVNGRNHELRESTSSSTVGTCRRTRLTRSMSSENVVGGRRSMLRQQQQHGGHNARLSAGAIDGIHQQRRSGLGRTISSRDFGEVEGCGGVGGGRRGQLSRCQSSRVMPSSLSTSGNGLTVSRTAPRRPGIERSRSSERLVGSSSAAAAATTTVGRHRHGSKDSLSSSMHEPRRSSLSRQKSVRSVSKERRDLITSSSSHKLTDFTW